MKAKDIRGKIYGKLVPMKRLENSENGKPRFECLCRCGNIVNVIGNNLITGNTRSCGCSKKNIKRSKSIYGKGICKRGNKYQARFTAFGKTLYAGTFDTIEEAKNAREEAIDYYKER